MYGMGTEVKGDGGVLDLAKIYWGLITQCETCQVFISLQY